MIKIQISTYQRSFIKAFTLAEILITLGIIGIVAVMTIPQLVTDITQNTFNTASRVFLAKLQEAANQMNVADELTGYTTNEQFADAFTRYVKVSKRCNSSNLNQCFGSTFRTGSDETVDTMTQLRTSGDLTMFDNTSPLVGFTLLNGTNVIMAYNPDCATNEADKYQLQKSKTYCMSMVYDVNASAGPNKMGKDILTLNATLTNCDGPKLGSLCVAAGDTTYSAFGTFVTPADETYSDYWAGAVKACSDQGMRLPSLTELGIIYGNRAIINGLDLEAGYWSNNEYNWYTAQVQRFDVASAGHSGGSFKSNTWALRCVN